ncbi:Uncharacterised protein [Pseudescherichia vulneris]|nr:Uncharacterised protein [Pseudescherichia vulneris]
MLFKIIRFENDIFAIRIMTIQTVFSSAITHPVFDHGCHAVRV